MRRRQGNALGLRDRRSGRNSLQARQRDRRVRSGRSALRGSPFATKPRAGAARFNSASRLASMTMSPKGFGAPCAAEPSGQRDVASVGSGRFAQMKRPDAYSPGERHGGDARKNFLKHPPRAIPTLERNLVECRFCPLHPSPYAYAEPLESNYRVRVEPFLTQSAALCQPVMDLPRSPPQNCC